MRLAICMTFVALTTATAAEAKVFNVNSTVDAVDSNPGNGVCATAQKTCTLRAAVQESNALAGADQINLAAATYKLTRTGVDEQQAARGDLDVLGDLTIRGVNAFLSIIDANGIDRAIDLSPVKKLTMSDVTITGGEANSTGGGVRYAGTLEAQRIIVRENRAVNDGGGLGTFFGFDPLAEGSLSLRDSIVSLNESETNAGGGIGHVFSAGKLSIENSIIVANTAASGGGGIQYGIGGGELRIERVTVYGNNTRFSFGGGASTDGAEVVVEKSLFSHNIIGLWGESKPFLQQGGGGLNINGGEARITNTTIENNVGSFGGGLRVNNTVKLVNVTIADNTALVEGGGIHSFADDNDVSVRNSIVANNEPDNCDDSTSLSLGNNIADDKTCGLKAAKDKENTDPLLGVLGNYGGATRTLPLKAGSPAINAAADADLNFDQRGVARPKLGGFDVGAFEYNGRQVLSITDNEGRPAACDQDRNGRIDFADLDRLITTFPAFGGRFRDNADAALERCVRRCTHAGCPSRALIEKPRRRAG